jgi:ABC-2 type transport system permease protein
MSAVAVTPPRPGVRTDAGPSSATLTRLELRKAVDTRAGFWLLAGIAGVAVVVALISALAGHDSEHTLARILEGVVQSVAVLLPVVGILLVTSEWSQRTALQTFTLVPRRGRVIAAKVAAGLVIAVAAAAFCFGVGALATAIAGSGAPGVWSLPGAVAAQALLYMATAMVIGIAFGTAFLASAPAVVLYFVLPLAWEALTALIDALDGVADWLSSSQSLDPMLRHTLSATDWAHAGVTLAVWMVLPLAVGVWRVRRSEVS